MPYFPSRYCSTAWRSLAASARGGLSADVLTENTQSLPGGTRVVVGLPSPDRAVTLWRSAGQRIASALATVDDVSIVVDAGRLTPTSPVNLLVAFQSS